VKTHRVKYIMSYRVTVHIFAERVNFEGLEKTRKRMLPRLLGKLETAYSE